MACKVFEVRAQLQFENSPVTVGGAFGSASQECEHLVLQKYSKGTFDRCVNWWLERLPGSAEILP
jgi:hypothetical protein